MVLKRGLFVVAGLARQRVKWLVMNKSTVEQIKARFDADVERFSNLELGQSTTVDAPITMALVAEAAAAATPQAKNALDVGCGAGNYSLKLLEQLPALNFTLNDLSQPMLDRAVERLEKANAGSVTTHQGDIRHMPLKPESVDIIVSAAALHHLRDDADWERVFAKLYRALTPGGSMWVSDMVTHENPAIEALIKAQYGDYLTALKDEAYRDFVFDYVEMEDSPRPVSYQLDLMRRVGFRQVDILHKRHNFAAFGGVK